MTRPADIPQWAWDEAEGAPLSEQIERKKAELASLELQAQAATCLEMGKHDWQFYGGANCGCQDGGCSVPVHKCVRCGDCDYGENDEAESIRRDCAIASEAT